MIGPCRLVPQLGRSLQDPKRLLGLSNGGLARQGLGHRIGQDHQHFVAAERDFIPLRLGQ